MMYDHIGLTTGDLEASIRFYKAILSALDYELCVQDSSSAGFGPSGSPSFWLYQQHNGYATSTHIAFSARDRAAVDAFHRLGLDSGGADNGAPGLRVDYSPDYYAAFLLDPNGNNVEAVCFS